MSSLLNQGKSMLSVSRFSLSTLAAFKDVMKLLMAMLAFVICSTAAHAQVFTNIKTINGIYSTSVRDVFVNGSFIYAATRGPLTDGVESGLSISTNDGASFTTKTTFDGLVSNVVNGVYASGSTVYAATNDGLGISTDGGTSFTNKTTTNGLGSNSVFGVYASGSTVYAATGGGLSISSDSPTVTAVSQNSGSTAGGTSITITGTNLIGATGISVGGSACSAFSVTNSTTATCTTPAGSAGIASVLVTTAGGTNAANTLFTYVTTISSATPIPTLSEWAMILMTGLMGIFAFMRLRKS